MINSYIPRPDFDAAIDELAALFDSGSIEPQLVSEAREFLSQHKIDCLRLVIGGKPTVAAHEVGTFCPRFEPSDLLLRLIAAIRANSINEFRLVTRGHIPNSADLDS